MCLKVSSPNHSCDLDTSLWSSAVMCLCVIQSHLFQSHLFDVTFLVSSRYVTLFQCLVSSRDATFFLLLVSSRDVTMFYVLILNMQFHCVSYIDLLHNFICRQLRFLIPTLMLRFIGSSRFLLYVFLTLRFHIVFLVLRQFRIMFYWRVLLAYSTGILLACSRGARVSWILAVYLLAWNVALHFNCFILTAWPLSCTPIVRFILEWHNFLYCRCTSSRRDTFLVE